MNVKENVFFPSEREFKKALRDTLIRAAWYELLWTMENCGKKVTFLCLGISIITWVIILKQLFASGSWIYNNYSMSPSWIWSDKITNERVARVGYNHFIPNEGEWNNCFSKFSNGVLLPIFVSTILQSVRKENLAHYSSYDVKLRLLAHSRSFLANQKARNAIVGAENLLMVNIPLDFVSGNIHQYSLRLRRIIVKYTWCHVKTKNSWARHFTLTVPLSSQAPVVQRLDNAIHRINRYPVDKSWQSKPRYPLDSVIYFSNNRGQVYK